MSNNQDPLIDIAMIYTQDFLPKLSDEEKNSIRNIFSKYINKKVDFLLCSQKIKEIIGSTIPVERIREILEISNDPLPSKENQEISTDNSGLRKKTQQWSKTEDFRLIGGIRKYGLDNWAQVATFVGNNRTRSQCSQRWFRVLDPRISRKHWTKNEDEKLLELVKLHGDKSWIKIALILGNRSDVQCRYHYFQLQRESKKELSFDSSDSSTISVSENNKSNSFMLKESVIGTEYNETIDLNDQLNSQSFEDKNFPFQFSDEFLPNQCGPSIQTDAQQNKKQNQPFISKLPKVQVYLNNNMSLNPNRNSLSKLSSNCNNIIESPLTKTISAQNNKNDISFGNDESLPLNIEFFNMSYQSSLNYESLWPLDDF